MISFAISESDGSTSEPVLSFLGNMNDDIELASFTNDDIDERTDSASQRVSLKQK